MTRAATRFRSSLRQGTTAVDLKIQQHRTDGEWRRGENTIGGSNDDVGDSNSTNVAENHRGRWLCHVTPATNPMIGEQLSGVVRSWQRDPSVELHELNGVGQADGWA